MNKLLLAAALAFAPATACAQQPAGRAARRPRTPPPRRAGRAARPTPIRRSGWCATPTPLSICSAPSTCSTAALVQRRGQDRVRRLGRAGARGGAARGSGLAAADDPALRRRPERARACPAADPGAECALGAGAGAARRAGRRIRRVRALVRVDDPDSARPPSSSASTRPTGPRRCSRSAAPRPQHADRRARGHGMADPPVRQMPEEQQLAQLREIARRDRQAAGHAGADARRLVARRHRAAGSRSIDAQGNEDPALHRILFTNRNNAWAAGSGRGWRGRARCSSPSAPAISPAATACSPRCAAAASAPNASPTSWRAKGQLGTVT